MAKSPKIAIVHDWLYGGGAEKVVEQLHKIYPKAPIYTSYCSDEWREKLGGQVITGYLQKWPFSKLRRLLPALRQRWFRSLDLSDYDIIISSSGNGEAKFVKKSRPDQIHICYCHTPTHFYWRHYRGYLQNPSFRPYWLAKLGLKTMVKPLRKNDYEAAQKVDYFIANSTAISKDIKKFYNRDSKVIFPPVKLDKFKKAPSKNSTKTIPENPRFITWGRVVPMKRLDIAIEAFGELGWNLDIVGKGPEVENLKNMAGSSVKLHGFIEDEELPNLIKKADGFIFCSYEDFGIAPVEALASGLPVLALEKGGALDYVKNDFNGWFFKEQTKESLLKTLKSLPGKKISLKNITSSADNFSEEIFRREIVKFVNSKWEEK